MKQQLLEVDDRKGSVKLTTHVDTRDVDKINSELRKVHGKGFTRKKAFRAVADIPIDFLKSCVALGDVDAIVLDNSDADPIAKRVALRRFLSKYPEFYISEGRI